MNTISVIQKCVAELQKENPRKDYILGMLEALIDTADDVSVNTKNSFKENTGSFPKDTTRELSPAEKAAQAAESLSKL